MACTTHRKAAVLVFLVSCRFALWALRAAAAAAAAGMSLHAVAALVLVALAAGTAAVEVCAFA
jgi:heme A synthase